MNRLGIALSLFGLLTSVGTAKKLTLESMNDNVSVRDPEFSPDSRRIAVVSDRSGRSKIWILSMDGSTPHLLLDDDGSESSPRWSPDGRTIAFLRRDGGQSDIWLVSATGENPRNLTNDSGGERAIEWAPDGSRIAFISDRAKHQDLYTVDVSSGVVDQVTEETNPWDEFRWAPCWAPDSQSIAYVSNRSSPFADDLWLADLNDKTQRKLTADLHVMTTPRWSADGRYIAFNAMKVSEFWYGDMSDLYVVEMPSRSVRKVEMNTYTSDRNGGIHVNWSPDSQFVYFRYEWQGDSNLWSVPVTGGVATQMTYDRGSFSNFVVSPDGKWISFVRSSPGAGGELFAVPVAGGPPRQLTNWYENYDGVQPPQKISFRSTDGKYILGYLYTPPSFDPSRQYPMLVQVHGGGNNAYGNGFHVLEQLLAQNGYVVLAIEYRGSAGHGREFQDLSLGEWAAGQGWDAVAAARFLKGQPYSNGKVGIYGGSYGGIMSVAAVTRDSEPFDAVAPFYGIFDWEDAYRHGDRLMQFWVVEGHFGFKPGENPDLYEHTASIKHVDRIKKDLPFLIIHGERDRRAPFQQSVRLVEALQKNGNPVEFHSYPEEGHGFRQRKNRLHAYGRLLDFFKANLQ